MDEADALSEREQRALAAWADDDPPEGFADAVVAAWLLEQEGAEAEPVASIRSARRDRGPLVGIVAGLAAAAAVLLMVRTLPSVARSAQVSEPALGCDHGDEDVDRPSPLAALVEPSPERDAAPVPAQTAGLATDALAALTRHCMPCHDGADADAEPGALQVYDVRRARWWEAMSDEQLREAQTRIEQLGEASEQERRSMAAFVDAQLRHRGTTASPS